MEHGSGVAGIGNGRHESWNMNQGASEVDKHGVAFDSMDHTHGPISPQHLRGVPL